MSLTSLRSSLEWALLVALVLGGGTIAQAAKEDEQTPGKIVQIAPAGDDEIAVEGEVVEEAEQPVQVELPKHWIGVLGGPIGDELRAQIDLPEGQGVLVRQVVPESPAAKAGLKNFDIVLRANDADLSDMGDLSELVRTEGERGGNITLEVLRRSQRETLTITPEERPEQIADMQPGIAGMGGRGWGQGGPMQGNPEEMMRFFEERLGHRLGRQPGQPMEFRMFGPGIVLNGHPGAIQAIPNGVSVSIQKQNDEPAQITVKRGNETWNIVGDDPGSLEQLPEDVRPFVEQLLSSSGGALMPSLPHLSGTFDDDVLQQRLHKMEQQLQQMQLMFEHGIETSHAEDQLKSESE